LVRCFPIINPRAHMERDSARVYDLDLNGGFNPRAHMGRDLSASVIHTATSLFQSMRPHGARREFNDHVTDLVNVSIHAPTWGATPTEDGTGASMSVSIHAPTWGATQRARVC